MRGVCQFQALKGLVPLAKPCVQNGQLPGMIGEVARGKALAKVLSKATVTDTNSKDVDLSSFTDAMTAERDDFVEASAGTASDDHDGHDHGGARDSHGRKPGHEHYGHDHK